MTEEKYNIKFAAAAVRGYIKREGIAENIESFLLNEPLESLTDSEKAEITALGAVSLALFKAGSSIPASMAMMAITTNSSISVNAD